MVMPQQAYKIQMNSSEILWTTAHVKIERDDKDIVTGNYVSH